MAAKRGAKRERERGGVDALRAAGKRSGWKSSGGFLFRSVGDLFFLCLGGGGGDELSLTLRFKWRAFDEAFWAVTGSPQLAAQPESFRARGAFVAPNWTLGAWSGTAAEVLAAADARVEEAVRRSPTLAQHMVFLDELHAALKARYPQASVDVERERVLLAALDDDPSAGLSVARPRADAGDTGGFVVGNEGFFLLAVRYFEERQRGGGTPIVVARR